MNINQAPIVDPTQAVETNAYVPTYNIKPEFKQAILTAIGKYPFKQIQSIMQAVKVEQMDHNTLTQIMNALSNFPYESVSGLLENINSYIEMVQPEDPAEDAPAPVVEEAPTGSAKKEEGNPGKAK